MVVIADASPLNYLVLIDRIELLQRLFTQVFVPDQVLEELRRPEAPPPVSQWVANRPDWVQRVAIPLLPEDPILEQLGMGARAAIALAETALPDVLLVIDEVKGRRIARQRQIPIVGILGILELSAAQGWIDLPAVVAELRGTSFWIAPDLIESLLDRDSSRKTKRQSPKETDF